MPSERVIVRCELHGILNHTDDDALDHLDTQSPLIELLQIAELGPRHEFWW